MKNRLCCRSAVYNRVLLHDKTWIVVTLNLEAVSGVSLWRRGGQDRAFSRTRGVGCLHFMVQSADPRQGHLTIKSTGKTHQKAVLFYLIVCMKNSHYRLGSSEVCTALYPDLEFTLISSLPFSLCVAAKANTQR